MLELDFPMSESQAGMSEPMLLKPTLHIEVLLKSLPEPDPGADAMMPTVGSKVCISGRKLLILAGLRYCDKLHQ